MSIKQTFALHQSAEKQYICPICKGEIKAKPPASLVCRKGHCFDLSKYGYVNFSPQQKPTQHYSQELFANRRKIFDKGYYEPLAKAIHSLITEYVQDEFCLLDVGCGEGYYDCYLNDSLERADIYALDNLKEPIKMGARANKAVKWVVGNLANIPLAAGTADVILEVFAPSNYAEFTRVLKDDGLLLKVIPGENYLYELRDRIEDKKTGSGYSSQPVKSYFDRHMNLVKAVPMTYERSVDSLETAREFLEMSPMGFGKDKSSIDLTSINQLTFDFLLLVGRKQAAL